MKKLSIKSKKRILEIISLVFFLSGILILINYKIQNKKLDNKEQEMIDMYFKKQETDVDNVLDKGGEENIDPPYIFYNYVGVLEIPKINLRKGFTSIDDNNNDVNKNIELLKESDMPNVVGGNLIIAGHSGIGRIAYFNNINKLSNKDIINIYYNNKKYIYEVVDKYEIDKKGIMNIRKDKNKTTLTLITCSTSNEKKQIVIISYLKQID